jgi:hypothetical protein
MKLSASMSESLRVTTHIQNQVSIEGEPIFAGWPFIFLMSKRKK